MRGLVTLGLKSALGAYLLALADTEHSGPTCRAYALGGWSSVLQGYLRSVTDFPAISALYTIALHNLLLLDRSFLYLT